MCIKTSESISKVSSALIKAQKAIKTAVFDAQNPHFRSKYATLGAVVEACKEALNSNGLCFIQGSHSNPELPNMVCVTTRILHESGEFIEDTIAVPYAQQTAQALGSSLTYGRRYGLASLLGIVSDEDDDAESAMPLPVKVSSVTKTKQPPKTKRQIVTDLYVQTLKGDPKEFPAWCELIIGRRIAKSTELTEAELQTIIDNVKVENNG